MSWIVNGRFIRDTLFTDMSQFQADSIRYNCQLLQELEAMPRGPTTYTVLKGSVVRETDKAVRFSVCQAGHILDGECFWFPLSQIKRITNSHNECEDEMEVADWLIEAKANEITGMGG